MNIVLKIGSLDLSSRLSTYSVTKEITYRTVLTTLDETEHAYPGKVRPIINFDLIPGTDEEDRLLYTALGSLVFNVTYMENGVESTIQMRLVSNLESVFLLTSADGKRRYRQGTIQLRGV